MGASDDVVILPWTERPAGLSFDAVAELWNAGAAGRHAFFPWTGDLLARQLDVAAGWDPAGLLLALDAGGRLAGAVQATAVDDASGYEPAGSLELLVVRPDRRRRGIGTALVGAAEDHLRARGMPAVEALGPWPYSPNFHALADGSERSGVFRNEPGLGEFFARLGFVEGRESRVLRRVTDSAAAAAARVDHPSPRESPPGTRFYLGERRGEDSWLDHSFRAWTLWDHGLTDERGYVYSRAIYARMTGLSEHAGREHYALFGVYTPPWARRRGWARRNLAAAMARLESLGAAVVELHCYADNVPALELYARLGFEIAAETRAMRKPLSG